MQPYRSVLRSAALACLLLAGGTAAAQQVDCQAQFNAVRGEYDKYGKAIEAANKRHATAQEACSLFKSLVEAQGRMFKFLKDNKVACNVPEEVLKNLTTAVAKTAETKTKVCNAATTAGGGPRPPSAGLSGAINVTGEVGGPPPDNNSGGGLFDTLNGNVLQR